MANDTNFSELFLHLKLARAAVGGEEDAKAAVLAAIEQVEIAHSALMSATAAYLTSARTRGSLQPIPLPAITAAADAGKYIVQSAGVLLAHHSQS